MSELSYPYADHPAPGTTQEVADGVRWLTMPMPGSLSHINLYLLEDRGGWWVVDTGLSIKETGQWWREVFSHELGGRPVKGVICTHMHPDHIGQSKMITDEYRCPLYMTRAEYYQARAFANTGSGHHSSWLGQEFYARAGMPRSYLEDLATAWGQ
ncbi:MAG: MBL fold metallo-hydrolase, partial [Gammaproteobacteria bacterium]|nr:MBL fold metallo-hydrolase [Gammaproteobacteria bacterium]